MPKSLPTDAERLRALFAGAAPHPPAAEERYRPYASLFPLVERKGALHVLLAQKKISPGYIWSGQIGMVGGGVEDTDRDDLSAAFREWEEETALPPAALDTLGDLGWYPSALADATLHVFTALWDGAGDPVPDPREIARLIEAPVEALLRTHDERGYAGVSGESLGEKLVYPVEEGVIWGVTARATHAFLERIRGGS